jgi:2-C-methyl-D-erythritol 2,4-cyclodiphosphate synthase
MGYDTHRLEEGYPCRLGGVTFNYKKGLVGYSDADVLLHAVCDALLGAAGLGDLGRYFPEGDPQWKGISSLTLLEEVYKRLMAQGYRVVNVDTVVIAEGPKIAPHADEMKKNISRSLSILENQVNIKATTNEKIGFVGREEGIVAYAVCLIEHD